MLCAKNSPKNRHAFGLLACLRHTDIRMDGQTDDGSTGRTGKKQEKSKQQKVAKIIFSEAHTSEQEMLRHHSAALERQYDHKIQQFKIDIYIYILIHNTKYAPSHCHINIPVQYSMYDTYSLYSNYEYNLMCYLYTSFCITALIESYWIRYMLTWHHS